ESWHRDVHQHEVRRLLLDHLQGLAPVSGFSDDLGGGKLLEQSAKSGADQGVVIGQHDPQGNHRDRRYYAGAAFATCLAPERSATSRQFQGSAEAGSGFLRCGLRSLTQATHLSFLIAGSVPRARQIAPPFLAGRQELEANTPWRPTVL